VELACTLGGEHISTATKRRSGSQKTNCPFLLVGIYKTYKAVWKLEVREDTHNHEPAKYMEAHAFARRMTPEQENTVGTLHVHGMGARRILKTVRKLFPSSYSVKKDIYNTGDKVDQADRIGDNPMQVNNHKPRAPLLSRFET
jgi:malonate-semialdehyde dehydrogenase (acetylating)/methylmalonate-semialdehyde dehydrogenase